MRKLKFVKVGKSLFVLNKNKAYPEGTVRSWGGGKHKKVGGIWMKTQGGQPQSSEDPVAGKGISGKVDSTSKDNARPQGSKEMFAALQRIKSETVYMDDLGANDKKAFNKLSKLGLVDWEYAGSGEEYTAKLTERGSTELSRAHAAKRTMDRAAEKAQSEDKGNDTKDTPSEDTPQDTENDSSSSGDSTLFEGAAGDTSSPDQSGVVSE